MVEYVLGRLIRPLFKQPWKHIYLFIYFVTFLAIQTILRLMADDWTTGSEMERNDHQSRKYPGINLEWLKTHKNLRSGKLVPLLRFKPHTPVVLMQSVTVTSNSFVQILIHVPVFFITYNSTNGSTNYNTYNKYMNC